MPSQFKTYESQLLLDTGMFQGAVSESAIKKVAPSNPTQYLKKYQFRFSKWTCK